MNTPSHTRLLGQAAAALATRLGQPVQWQPHPQQLPYVRLLVGPQPFTACLLPHLPAAVTNPLTAPTEVLITTYLSFRQAEALQQQGQQYLDGAGNAFLRTPSSFILIQGRPRPTPTCQPITPPRASWQPASLRLLYYLLSEPDLLQAPYRTISARVGVALGSVHTFFARARQQQLLHEVAGGGRRWVAPADLLAHWVQGYAQVLRPTLGAQRYRWREAPGIRWRQLPVPGIAYWSGEPAAHILLQEKHIAPTSFTFYCAGPLPAWGLLPDPLFGTVEVLAPPFPLPGQGAVAHTLLVYTDLLLSGQQGRAQQVLEKCLPHLR